jgi:drug/metabolite transporter (DMT)-like permease
VIWLGILLLILSMLMWSFVGTLVKLSLVMFDSTTVTFFRFFFGVVFLAVLLLIKDRKIVLRGNLAWIWIAAVGKCCNYFFENMGLLYGYSYGNMLVSPIQTVFMLFMTVFYFKEKVTPIKWCAAVICIGGVLVISWNGLPLHLLFQGSGFTTLLFVVAGVGAGLHFVSQKVLISSMDAGNMNFTVFFWSSLIILLPTPFTFHWSGAIRGSAIFALIALGVITGVSFYFFSIALKKVSFLAATLVSNATPLFMILWGKLFFGDPVTIYILVGTAAFLSGILLMNLPVRRPEKVPIEDITPQKQSL